MSAGSLLTGGDPLFTSSAEGFVAIARFLVGQVYRRVAQAHGLGVALRRLLQRAWLLYLLAAAITLVVVPLARLFDLPWPAMNDVGDTRGLLWGIFTLRQTSYLADIRLLYALLLGSSPLAFILLFEGRAWLVLGISWGCWLAYQVDAAAVDLPWPIRDNTVFDFSTWQVLFISAMVLAYHGDTVRARLKAAWDVPLPSVTGVGVAGLIALHATSGDARVAVSDPSSWWLAKNVLDPVESWPRSSSLDLPWVAVSRLWVPLQRAFGWLLLPLGQNSLFACATHVPIVLLLGVVSARLDSGSVNALLQIARVATVCAAIRLKPYWPAWRAHSAWLAGPAPLILAAALLLWANPVPGRCLPAQTSR